MRKFILFVLLVGGLIYFARDAFRTGKIDQFLREKKETNWAPKAVYGLAVLSYLFQQHQNASRYFEWLIQDYAEHPKIDKIRWEVAQCYEELGEKQKALEQYTILRSSYSSTHYGRLGSARYEKIRF